MAPIEVFADICCPFTHLGLRRLVDRRRALGREEPRLHVRAWPLELVNGTPLDGELIGDEVDELRRQVAPDLFRGYDQSAFPHSSLPAFALAAVAYQRDLATGEAVSLALRAALFEEGRNIASPAVLAEIATRHHLRSLQRSRSTPRGGGLARRPGPRRCRFPALLPRRRGASSAPPSTSPGSTGSCESPPTPTASSASSVPHCARDPA